MADYRDRTFRDACDRISKNCKYPLQLKVKQHRAVASFLEGNDVLAVLPMGFGKSLISKSLLLLAKWKESVTTPH